VLGDERLLHVPLHLGALLLLALAQEAHVVGVLQLPAHRPTRPARPAALGRVQVVRVRHALGAPVVQVVVDGGHGRRHGELCEEYQR